jgi:hypothetical protein
MIRFNTKNLSEQQLDAFKMSDDEYFLDRPEFDSMAVNYEDLARDLKMAMNKSDGRIAVKVAEKLLNYLTAGVYEKLEAVKQDPKYDTPYLRRHIQGEIDKIQTVNQDVIKDAIKVLKVSPKNMTAMQTIYDIIDDLWSYVD